MANALFVKAAPGHETSLLVIEKEQGHSLPADEQEKQGSDIADFLYKNIPAFTLQALENRLSQLHGGSR